MNISNLFLFGACDLYDAVHGYDKFIKGKYFNVYENYHNSYKDKLKFTKDCRPKYSTSLESIYTPPGPIAARVHESLFGRNDLKPHHYQIYSEITKYPYINYYQQNARSGDILALNFSFEFFTKAKIGKEVFSIFPTMTNIRYHDDPLNWLWKEYLIHDKYHVNFDAEENADVTYQCIIDFVKDLIPIFNDRIICVSTNLTNLAMFPGTKQILKIPQVNLNLCPFYRSTRIIKDTTDYESAAKVLNANFYNRIISKKLKINLSTVDYQGNCFMDLEHPDGITPFHLVKDNCREKGYLIFSEAIRLDKLYKENSLQQSNNLTII